MTNYGALPLVRRATIAAASAILAAASMAALSPTTAAAVPVAAEQVILPPSTPAWNDADGWQVMVGGSMLWADGTLRRYEVIDGISWGPMGTEYAWLRPPGTGAPVSGGRVVASTKLDWQGALEAVDGSTLALRTRLDESGENGQLSDRIDDLGRVHRQRLTTYFDVAGGRIVPTPRGGRIIGHVDELGGRRRAKTVVVDGAGELRQTLRAFLVSSVDLLSDGRVLLTGARVTSKWGRTPARAMLGTDGKLRMLSREPALPGGRIRAEATPTRVGLVSPTGVPSELPGSGFALRSAATGKLRVHRTLDDLGIPWPQGCRIPDAVADFRGVIAGSAGYPVVSFGCAEGSTFAVELDGALRYRRTVLDTGPRPPGAGTDQITGASLGPTLPDGRLGVFHYNGQIGALDLPGAYPVEQGRVRSVRRDGKRGELVRISCRRPYGSVCSGTAEIVARGKVVGSAFYALPGRPGVGESVIERHVPTGSTVPKRPTARLVAGAS